MLVAMMISHVGRHAFMLVVAIVTELRAYCSVVLKEAKAVAMERLRHEVRMSRQLKGRS